MAARNVVLVVDDNPTVGKFVAAVLKPLGYQVESCRDGIEALQRISREEPGLILLDFVMPRMNGFHFCQALDRKKLAPGATIVLLSTVSDRVGPKMRQMTRVTECLGKPFTPEQLREVAGKFLPLDGRPPVPAPAPPPVQVDRPGFSSDLFIADPTDLEANVRDILQTAIADGMVARLDALVAASNRDDVLDLISQIVEGTVDQVLVGQVLSLVSSAAAKGGQRPG